MAAELRIRMYRTGFGDCFLLSFGPTASARHVLIDFGVHASGQIGTMDSIMDNIEEATRKKLEVVVATHAHRDHISGFGEFADRFADFSIGEVWLPWTDNPKDPEAAALQKKQLALYDRLDNHLRLALGADESDPRYAAALNALSNLKGNGPAKAALGSGFGVGATPRYFRGGDAIAKVGAIAGLSADILSPPRDKAYFSRMDPPADQRFLAAPGDTRDAVRPFPGLEVREKDARDFRAIVRDGQPIVEARDLAGLTAFAEAPADRLALALDNVRNNTSLVILFRYKGKTLLFPGDAQWGNWQSWIRADGAREILGAVDFLKVAHHGSENATPVDVVHELRAGGVAAMVPTQVRPFPTIPRLPLIAELQRHCVGHLAVRSDWIDVRNAPKGPAPKPKLPKGFKAGEPGSVWIDCHL